MKKLLIAAVFCIGFAGSSFAQQMDKKHEMKSPEERAKMMTEMMDKKLSLTADQKSKIYEINLERARKMEKMRSADSKERAKKMEDRKELMSESDKKMQKVLTAEQRKTYDELKARRMEREKKGGRKMDHKKMMNHKKMNEKN